MKKNLQILISALALIGACISVYLWTLSSSSDVTFCPTDGCESVLVSKYSTFLGFPVAGWGLLFYLSVIVVALARHFKLSWLTEKQLRLIQALQIIVGIAFTIYLRYLEFFVLHEICFWCWWSVVVIFTISGLLVWEAITLRKTK